MENPAVHFEKGSPKWFGLTQHVNNRLLKQIRVYRAIDSQKFAQLPLRAEATRFLREPDV
ncbi:hypothetical protein A5753_20880 [Mycobacterium sp. 852002-51971_SCH5477799-a]|nr:hypothetical protein A5753_20880 [Mycobacterium sp. 852002-51971_SCH5477799-a]